MIQIAEMQIEYFAYNANGFYCSLRMGVTNRTINNGFLVPMLVKERTRSYMTSEYSQNNKKVIVEILGNW